MDTIDTTVKKWLESATDGPRDPNEEFIRGGVTAAAVFRKAGGLQQIFGVAGDDGVRRVCLCTGDRALAAAAVLASLDGRTQLLLPHAPSPAALADLYARCPYGVAVIDDASVMPPGVTAVTPTGTIPASDGPVIGISVDADWVRLFTGGSTGTPRIWPKSPRNLLGEALFQAAHHGITSADTIVATVSPQHIYGLLFSVLVPLTASAVVVPGTPVFPAEIADTVARSGATILVSVPAHYRVLGTGPVFGNTLRKAFSSAGPLAPEDGEAFTRRTGTPLVEVYGSTETGGIATRCRASGETGYTPLPAVDWRVDGDRLSVRSSFLSASLPVDDKGYFTTADRVTRDGAGGFALGGRTDAVVKVGGKRVDLNRIHEALMAISGVTGACVLALPAAGGRQTDIAVLVETQQDRASIMAPLAVVLEPHEMPRRLQTIEQVPMTEAGKVDRTAAARLLSRSG